jgi:hypothetical protein
MTTVRQIQRQWDARKYGQLLAELVSSRPEAEIRFDAGYSIAVPAAAMTIIRLDEIGQSHTPLYSQLIRTLVATQHADGGWGDPMITALSVRALLRCKGQGAAIDRGLVYLLNLQKPEGIWPAIPIRRMAADTLASAFVLLQLGDSQQFRDIVRFEDAVRWFSDHENELDAPAQKVWERARIKCRLPKRMSMVAPVLWS